MGFGGFCRDEVTEMSISWSGVVDVGDEEHSEGKADGVVGEVAVTEDMAHSLEAEYNTKGALIY